MLDWLVHKVKAEPESLRFVRGLCVGTDIPEIYVSGWGYTRGYSFWVDEIKIELDLNLVRKSWTGSIWSRSDSKTLLLYHYVPQATIEFLLDRYGLRARADAAQAAYDAKEADEQSKERAIKAKYLERIN